MSSSAFRIQKDLREIVTTHFAISDSGPPILAVPVDDKLNHLRALIVGPKGTPYAHGFFLFDLTVPEAYPNEPPTVKILTNDNGRCRFNPNLYADGKVCLSILGTWRGESTETWRASYSLRYVLQCIQCTVMNDQPFYNEPGFAKEQLEAGLAALELARERDRAAVNRQTESESMKAVSDPPPDDGSSIAFDSEPPEHSASELITVKTADASAAPGPPNPPPPH